MEATVYGHKLSFLKMSIFIYFFSTTPQVLSPTITSPPNALPRRSSRLFTSDSSTTKVMLPPLKFLFINDCISNK